MSPGRRIAGRGLPRSPGPVRIDAITEPLPRAADAEHITEVLRRSGAKGLARVSNVAVTSSLKKLRSHTLRLHLDYESSTPPCRVLVRPRHGPIRQSESCRRPS